MKKARIIKLVTVGLIASLMPIMIAAPSQALTPYINAESGMTCYTPTGTPTNADYGALFTTATNSTITQIQFALTGFAASDLTLSAYIYNESGTANGGQYYYGAPLATFSLNSISNSQAGTNPYNLFTFLGSANLAANTSYFVAINSTASSNYGQVCTDTTTVATSSSWFMPTYSGAWIWTGATDSNAIPPHGFSYAEHLDFEMNGNPDLAAPSSPTVTNSGSGQIDVSESAGVSGAASYEVDVYQSDGVTFVESATVTTGNITTPTTFSGLNTGATYKISVTANGNGISSGNSFPSVQTSIFTTAAVVSSPTPTPAAPPMPDPVQESTISGITPATAIAGNAVPVNISGLFYESIKNIDINGAEISRGSWTQSLSNVAFTFTPANAGTYNFQLYNGSYPLLSVQSITVAAQPTAPAQVGTSAQSGQVTQSALTTQQTTVAKARVTYIHCYKGKSLRIAYGINPVCPIGFVKKQLKSS
jgi:hypothetical protein